MAELAKLETPCLVLDRGRVAANAARLQAHLGALGVPLRLHVKTAKSPQVTELVLGGRRAPIAVSTLKEAERFLEAGYRDILYAECFTPDKLPRAQQIVRRGARLTLVVDSVAVAQGIRGFPALIEIDTDGHRPGLKPDDPRHRGARARHGEAAPRPGLRPGLRPGRAADPGPGRGRRQPGARHRRRPHRARGQRGLGAVLGLAKRGGARTSAPGRRPPARCRRARCASALRSSRTGLRPW